MLADATIPPAVGAYPLRAAAPKRYVRAMSATADPASSAIEAVVTRFRTMMRSVSIRRGLSEADIDEVVQEVRIRLWRARDAGKPIEELGSSYLYQVASSAALDLLRRRRARGGDRTEDASMHQDLPAADPSPAETTEAGELEARIQDTIATLPKDRRVVVRFHLAGYDRADMQRALGWSEARVRNLLYRGLDELRRRLAARGITPELAG